MQINTKFQAFAIHLAISLLIFLLLLGIILYFWFPNGLIYAGGIEGLKLIVGVDVVLGPILTFVVYKKGKKELKTDLSLIALLQISCLAIGTWIVYNERPVAQILLHDGVHFVSYGDAKEREFDLSNIPNHYPKRIFIDLPEDTSTWNMIVMATEMMDKIPFKFRNDLYEPLDDVEETKYRRRIKDIQEMQTSTALTALISKGESNCDWIPVVSLHNEGHACFSQTKGVTELSDKRLR